jgi:hypothetical protein
MIISIMWVESKSRNEVGEEKVDKTLNEFLNYSPKKMKKNLAKDAGFWC